MADIAIPRKNLMRSFETSPLISRRDPSGPGNNWSKIQESRNRVSDGTNQNGQLAALVNQALRNRPQASAGLFPFKIYQMPIQYSGVPSSTYWRTFWIRNGLILNSTINPASGPCIGSDQVDRPWYDVYQSQAAGTLITGVSGIVVPSGQATYYFWVDIASNTISYGANPASPDHGTAWSGWPAVSSGSVMIGWVDTNTQASVGRAIPQQVQVGHIVSNGGGGIAMRRFTINTVSGNPDIYGEYFIAADVDNGGTLTRIAKNFKLRNSITSQVIDGITWTYTYTTVVERTAATSGYSEYQRVSERYLAGDYVVADQVGQHVLSGASLMVSVADTISGTPGAAITWLDRNEDGRSWTANANQSGP